MKWTLVTGGAGFIGLNIAERLLAEGTHVVLFDVNAPPERARRAFASLPGRLHTVRGDVTSPSCLLAAIDRPVEAIVHAAAITAGPEREATAAGRVVAVNVQGAVNVALAAAAYAVKRVLLVSSAAVYGSPAGGKTLAETSACRPYTLYASTKYASELILRRLADLHGFSLVTARLGWVFGPWEHQSGVRDTMSSIHQASVAAIGGTPFVLPRGDNREWSYSRDVATALARLLSAPSPRWDVYNLNACARLDLSAWAERLRQTVGRPTAAAGPEPVVIDLFSQTDGPPMPADRFAGEFEMNWRSSAEAFSDYVDWLRADPWPVRGGGGTDEP